jgi:hypothetical protein
MDAARSAARTVERIAGILDLVEAAKGHQQGMVFAAAERIYDREQVLVRALRRLVRANAEVWIDGYLDDQREHSEASRAADEALAPYGGA